MGVERFLIVLTCSQIEYYVGCVLHIFYLSAIKVILCICVVSILYSYTQTCYPDAIGPKNGFHEGKIGRTGSNWNCATGRAGRLPKV